MQKGEQDRTALSQPQAERDVTWLDTPWTDGWTSRPQQEGMVVGPRRSGSGSPVSADVRAFVPGRRKNRVWSLWCVQNRGVRLGGRDFGVEGARRKMPRTNLAEGPSKGQAGQAGGREPGSREALPVWKEPGPLTIIHWMIRLSLSGCGLAPQGGRWREDTPSRRPLSPVRSGAAPVQPFACPAQARGAWVVPSNKPTWAPRQQSASTFCSAPANRVHRSNWSLWRSVWKE